MEKYIPVVVIKELSETDKILSALKADGINCAEITFRTAWAECRDKNNKMSLGTQCFKRHFFVIGRYIY